MIWDLCKLTSAWVREAMSPIWCPRLLSYAKGWSMSWLERRLESDNATRFFLYHLNGSSCARNAESKCRALRTNILYPLTVCVLRTPCPVLGPPKNPTHPKNKCIYACISAFPSFITSAFTVGYPCSAVEPPRQA